jgi:hypothetical protein
MAMESGDVGVLMTTPPGLSVTLLCRVISLDAIKMVTP